MSRPARPILIPIRTNGRSETMMSTMEVAKKLVELCQQGKNLEAVDTLYSPNIVSIEAMEMPDMPRRTEGIKAIRGKNEWWFANTEIHGGVVRGPWPHDDRFV